MKPTKAQIINQRITKSQEKIDLLMHQQNTVGIVITEIVKLLNLEKQSKTKEDYIIFDAINKFAITNSGLRIIEDWTPEDSKGTA